MTATLRREKKSTCPATIIRMTTRHKPLRTGGEVTPTFYMATGLTRFTKRHHMTFLKSVPGFTMPRFGGGCPLWPIFGAFSRPAQPVRAEVTLPGPIANRMLCYAVAEPVGVPQFDAPPALQSTMLVIPDQPASETAALPVGVSCRICPRSDCASRREPAIAGVGPQNSL